MYFPYFLWLKIFIFRKLLINSCLLSPQTIPLFHWQFAIKFYAKVSVGWSIINISNDHFRNRDTFTKMHFFTPNWINVTSHHEMNYTSINKVSQKASFTFPDLNSVIRKVQKVTVRNWKMLFGEFGVKSWQLLTPSMTSPWVFIE